MRRFANNERVRIVKTNDNKLDNQTGLVKGRFGQNQPVDFYIVLLDNPVEGYDPSLVMIESCLEIAA